MYYTASPQCNAMKSILSLIVTFFFIVQWLSDGFFLAKLIHFLWVLFSVGIRVSSLTLTSGVVGYTVICLSARLPGFVEACGRN